MKIVGVQLDEETRGINKYKLDNGEILNREQALQAYRDGKLDKQLYHIGRNQYGDFLATDREAQGEEITDLKDLPQF